MLDVLRSRPSNGESDCFRKAANGIASDFGAKQRRATVGVVCAFVVFASGVLVLARVTFLALTALMSPGTAFLAALLIHVGAAGGVHLAADAANDPPRAPGRLLRLSVGVAVAVTCLLAVVILAVFRGFVWLQGDVVGSGVATLLGLLFGLAEAAVDVFLGWQLAHAVRHRKQCATNLAWASEVKQTMRSHQSPAAGWRNEENRLAKRIEVLRRQDHDNETDMLHRDREVEHLTHLLELLRARNPGWEAAEPPVVSVPSPARRMVN
jgi:hypothetical protein